MENITLTATSVLVIMGFVVIWVKCSGIELKLKKLTEVVNEYNDELILIKKGEK